MSKLEAMRLVIAVPVVPETGGRVSARIVSVRRSRGFAGGLVIRLGLQQ
jgi:hypothetical protein